jgi:hypothetical protein
LIETDERQSSLSRATARSKTAVPYLNCNPASFVFGRDYQPYQLDAERIASIGAGKRPFVKHFYGWV